MNLERLVKTVAKKPKKTFKAPKSTPKTEEDHLNTLIKFSERAITNQSTGIDEFFRQQAERLKKQLEGLRKK